MKGSNRAIIIFGPPGAGKGTQSWLIAKRLGFINFDTGRTIERLVYSPAVKKSKTLQRERKIFESGKLNTSSWVLKILKENVGKISRSGMGVLLSGSPRTLFEAFGDKKTEGLVPFMIKIYGRKNITIFELMIPEKESLRRNRARGVCEICDTSFLRFAGKLKRCPICGGRMMKRAVDKPEVMKIRIKQYRTRTEPIFRELKKQGFKINVFSGTPLPFRVFAKLKSRIQANEPVNKNRG